MSIYDQKPVDPTQPIPESEVQVEPDVFEKDEDIALSKNFKDFSVGAGSTTFRVTKDGAWMGATNYDDAPIQFDYRNGKMNLFGTSVVLDGSTGIITVGNSNVKIDGPNKRIIINDGTNDRVLIGFLSGGF